MKYFSSLIPQITQNQDTFFDMFFNLDITNIIQDEFLVLYTLKDGETLQDLAYKYYDEPRLWWLICLINDIKDPFFDISKSNEYVAQEAIEYATINPDFWSLDDSELMWTGRDEDLFWYEQEDFLTEYERLAEENDEKREISVIKPEYLSDVITQIIEAVNNI